jgi:hypothetical protein
MEFDSGNKSATLEHIDISSAPCEQSRTCSKCCLRHVAEVPAPTVGLRLGEAVQQLDSNTPVQGCATSNEEGQRHH